MPIKGIKPVLAEAGKIKIGGLGPEVTSRKGNKFRPPVKYDQFLITTTQRNKDGDLIPDERLMKKLRNGHDKLRQIPIMLHSDDIEEVFPTCYAAYRGQQLFCRGDGEKATRWVFRDGKRTGDTQKMACPCPLLDQKKCKPHGTLNCMIRADKLAVAGAVHKWRTTSWNSIRRMLASLQQIKMLFGTLRGVPLRLKLDRIRVQPKEAAPKTVYCAYVECAAEDFASVQRRVLEEARMTAETRALMAGTPPPEGYSNVIDVPASSKETPEEQSRVAQEFHPEPHDPETGEVLVREGSDMDEPPDPEPDGEESPFDPADAGEHQKVNTVPKHHESRQQIKDLLTEVATMRQILSGGASEADWEDRLKAERRSLWEDVCQAVFGMIPEGEPTVTPEHVTGMRLYLKHRKMYVLLDDVASRHLLAEAWDRDAKGWEEKFQEIRKDHWAGMCGKVFKKALDIDAKLDEPSVDQAIAGFREVLEKLPALPEGGEDGG